MGRKKPIGSTARSNKNTLRYKSRRRKIDLPSRAARRHIAINTDLSDFEDKKDHIFFIEVGRQAAANAVNENKAMNIPITFLKDGWVIRKMPNGDIEKVAKLGPSTTTTRQRRFTKGTVLHVKKTD